MQTKKKKKKIEFGTNDIIITKSGYEVRPLEVVNQYVSNKNKIFISFNIPVYWNPETGEREQLKTIKQRSIHWSTLGIAIVDKITHIKKLTCKLRLIS